MEKKKGMKDRKEGKILKNQLNDFSSFKGEKSFHNFNPVYLLRTVSEIINPERISKM